MLRNIGFQDWFPEEQVFPEEIEEYSATLKAVRFARSKLSIDEPGRPATATERERSVDPLYYLV